MSSFFLGYVLGIFVGGWAGVMLTQAYYHRIIYDRSEK